MAPVVHTPVEGFNGIVVGVSFHDGVGETDDAAALGYFQSAGYRIDDAAVAAEQHAAPAGDAGQAAPAGDAAQAAPAGDADQTPPSGGAGEASPAGEAGQAPPAGSDDGKDGDPKRPYPQSNKAEWFDYLGKVKPGHGLTLENTKAEMIAAVDAK